MSEIINTGLGWWANEDWLRETKVKIGSISSGGGAELQPFPYFSNVQYPTYQQLQEIGIELSPGYKFNFYQSPNNPEIKVLFYVRNSRWHLIYLFVNNVFHTRTVYYSIPGDNHAYSISGSGNPSLYRGVYYFDDTLASRLDSMTISDTQYWHVSNATTTEAAIDEVLDSVTTEFYKLNNGYSVACFIRWLNVNQTELCAPILISSDQSYVALSLDGETESPGIVTGVEFGGIRFYINILLGYSGVVESTVPYSDLTTVFPEGINITELFRAIVTLAQVRFTDPYAEGGNSEPGGGGGTFDLESDVIGVPSLPTMSFAATGFTRIYNPTLSELNSLANYLWTDTTFLDTVINHLKQLLENPMDAIISLALLPCPIPNGSPEAVKVMFINTGVTMAPATSQFVDVDCGTLTLQEFYGSALDYNPYTKVHCYLPYIGQVTLDTDEVMGKTIHVRYRIDIVTGMCAALISVNQSTGLDETVMYQFSGHCSINMPINSADFSGYIGAAMTAGKMVAGVVAGASGNIPLAAELIGAPAPHSSTSETTEKTTERNPKTGRQVTAGTSTRTTTRNTPGASFGEMSRKAAANTVGAVMGSKLTVEHAGGFTGNSGYLAVRRPYLIIERPRMCNPEEYGRYNGRPSMIYMNLGECEGYTEVQSIQFENIPATNPELAELSELLKSGVLF